MDIQNYQSSQTPEVICPPVVFNTNTTDTLKRQDLVSVLHLINGEHYSGAERVQDLLALQLRNYGYQVGFGCLKTGRFSDARSAKDAPLDQLEMKHRFDWFQVSNIVRIIEQNNYQVIHAHTPRSLLMGMFAARKTGLPLVYHVHSPTSRDSTKVIRSWVNQYVERWAMKRAERLIPVSHSLAQHVISQGMKPEKIKVVHNGVPAIDQLEQRVAPTEKWTLGTVALFRPRKGIEVLLQALANLRQQGLSIKLRAVGPFETSEYEDKIKQLATQLNITEAIHWVGFSDNITEELQQMDLFVLPSLFGEGLPMVILESMAAGTPVLATKVEGVVEALDHANNGLIAEPNDPADLASKIEQMIAGKYNWANMRDQAFADQHEQFSDVSMARQVAAIYDQILKK